MVDPDELRRKGGLAAMRGMDMLDADGVAAFTKFCEAAYEAMDALKPEQRHEALILLNGGLIGVWHYHESRA